MLKCENDCISRYFTISLLAASSDFWQLLVQISGKQVVGMRFFLKNRIRISTITFKILYAKIDLLLCKLEINGIVKKCAVGEYPKSEIDRYQAA